MLQSVVWGTLRRVPHQKAHFRCMPHGVKYGDRLQRPRLAKCALLMLQVNAAPQWGKLISSSRTRLRKPRDLALPMLVSSQFHLIPLYDHVRIRRAR
jgi:hypothetical protein